MMSWVGLLPTNGYKTELNDYETIRLGASFSIGAPITMNSYTVSHNPTGNMIVFFME